MPKHDDKYSLFFAAVVTIVCSLILASAATLLKTKQLENVALDKRKNILMAFGFDVAGKDGSSINQLFEDKIKPQAIDSEGNEIAGLNAKEVEDLNAEEEQKKADPKARQLPIFVLNDKKGNVEAFTIPIQGKGLWSTLYGYLSLEKDANTVRGITYYKHGETPGLGAEVENADWQSQFKQDKKIYEKGKLVSIAVVKGKDTTKDPHAVNSISGATITSNGVTKMLEANLKVYAPYFEKKRS